MKLLNWIDHEENGRVKLGVVAGEGVFDVAAAADAMLASGGEGLAVGPFAIAAMAAWNTDAVIAGGGRALDALRELIARTNGRSDAARFYRSEDGLAHAPSVVRPGKLICIGLNYRKHAEETNAPIPASPVVFGKFANALAAHGDVVPLPAASREVDYEAELAIVIGEETRDVEPAEALSRVFGYSGANDVSARDLQMRTSQWLLGKTCDKFAPLGPWLVTADEIADPNALSIGCEVNGEVRQRSNTSDMIFRCDEIVSYLSKHMTLSPGDVILTGTPEGVVLGYPAERRVYLQPGDTTVVEIEGLGRLVNRFE